MRSSPDAQILGHPSTGIPRRALWSLTALVVLVHAWLLTDTGGLGTEALGETALHTSGLGLSTPGTDVTQPSGEPSPTAPIRWAGYWAAPAPSAVLPQPPTQNPQAEPVAPPQPEPEAVEQVVVVEVAVAQIQDAQPSEPQTDPTAAIEPVQPELFAEKATAEATTPLPNATAEPPLRVRPIQTRLVYEITGQVKGIRASANGQLDWTVKDGRYDAQLVVRMFLLGTRTQTSAGRIDSSGLKPERFGERQRDEAATHFDYEGQRVRFSRNRPDAPLPPGIQDRLSVMFELASLLQARQGQVQASQTIAIPVAGSRTVDSWNWTVGGMETLDLPNGPLLARHLKRPALNERDATIELWMAPDLQHLPARIRLTHSNGDWLDHRVVIAP